jgi:sugar-specific transcriptional regulator TrmB
MRLGLTGYEARAYLALLRRDSETAAQTARLANLPRQRIYDVLASLVDKGLASTHPGPAVKYAALAPDLALDRLVSDRREQLADLERETAALIQELGPACHAGREQASPLEYIKVLRDGRAIETRLDELQAGIKQEILVFTKRPYATPSREIAGLAIAQTHKARSVHELSVFDDPQRSEVVGRFIDAGQSVRFVPKLPVNLRIIDESIVVFGVKDPLADSSDQTMIVVEHPSIARILKIAFAAVWEQALTFDQASEQLDLRSRRSA